MLERVPYVTRGEPLPPRVEFPGYSSLTSSDLSGGQRQHHGYRNQAFYLAELLENAGRFEIYLTRP